MAEACRTLDPVLLIKLVPGPDRVVIEQQRLGDQLTAHAFVQQHQRVGAPRQPVLGQAVAGQLNQVVARFAVQDSQGGSSMNQNRLSRRWQAVFPDFRRVGVYDKIILAARASTRANEPARTSMYPTR